VLFGICVGHTTMATLILWRGAGFHDGAAPVDLPDPRRPKRKDICRGTAITRPLVRQHCHAPSDHHL